MKRFHCIHFSLIGIVRDPFVYLFPAYTRIPSKYIPYRNRARKANEDLRKILVDIIADRKRVIQEKSLTQAADGDGDKRPDLLTMMITAAQDHSNSRSFLTDGELISNLAVFFVAGNLCGSFIVIYYLLTLHNRT
jgi:cytochrome P450